jgi:hypothetical protein
MSLYIGAGAFALVGLIMFLVAVKSFIETIVFLRTSQKIEATVISYKTKYNNMTSSRSGASRMMYLPILQFQPPGGNVIRITSSVGSNPPAYNIGELAEVRYVSKNPHGAKLNSFFELWLMTAIFGCAGLFLLFFAYVCFTQR